MIRTNRLPISSKQARRLCQ